MLTQVQKPEKKLDYKDTLKMSDVKDEKVREEKKEVWDVSVINMDRVSGKIGGWPIRE